MRVLQSVGGLEYIVADHYKPFRVQRRSNEFALPHALFVGVLPVCVALGLAYFASPFTATNAGPIVAIYAVMASVLTAIMPTINSLIGGVERERIQALMTASVTSDSNIEEARVLVAKVEIVRGLYAAVAWSVIVLCAALIPLLLLSHGAFQSDTKTPAVELSAWLRVSRMALVVVVGFAGGTSFVALLQIVSGIHLLLRHNQKDVELGLKDLSDRYHL